MEHFDSFPDTDATRAKAACAGFDPASDHVTRVLTAAAVRHEKFAGRPDAADIFVFADGSTVIRRDDAVLESFTFRDGVRVFPG